MGISKPSTRSSHLRLLYSSGRVPQVKGVQEGEEKEQEIGNLFKNIMKENFPNLVKEIDVQVQEAQSPKQDGCKEAHSKTS